MMRLAHMHCQPYEDRAAAEKKEQDEKIAQWEKENPDAVKAAKVRERFGMGAVTCAS